MDYRRILVLLLEGNGYRDVVQMVGWSHRDQSANTAVALILIGQARSIDEMSAIGMVEFRAHAWTGSATRHATDRRLGARSLRLVARSMRVAGTRSVRLEKLA